MNSDSQWTGFVMKFKLIMGLVGTVFSIPLLLNKPVIFFICWLIVPAGIWATWPKKGEENKLELIEVIKIGAFLAVCITGVLGYLLVFGSLFGNPMCEKFMPGRLC